MPLQIIGADFGRLDTLAPDTAPRQLGYPSSHMMEVLQNQDNTGHLGFWCRVADAL